MDRRTATLLTRPIHATSARNEKTAHFRAEQELRTSTPHDRRTIAAPSWPPSPHVRGGLREPRPGGQRRERQRPFHGVEGLGCEGGGRVRDIHRSHRQRT